MNVLDLNAVISDSETMLRRTLGNDVRMTAIFASSLDPIRADARKVQQVVLSLVARARQAMPTGGRFTIETKNVRIDRGLNANVPPGPYVMLTLSDSGASMNEAALRAAFDPRAKFETPALASEIELDEIPAILHQFGGHIHVESQPGQGAAFKILLPCCDNPMPPRGNGAHSRADSARNPFAMPSGMETVLLVEDEDSVRTLVRIVLQSCGYGILEAVSGEEALHIAETYDAPIDLLVTDVCLPHIDGKVLVDRLIALRPSLKVLFISGSSHDKLTHFGFNSMNFAFLQKPFKCDALVNMVRHVLDTSANVA